MFLTIIAFVGNPFLFSAYKNGLSAASPSSTDSSTSSSSSGAQQFSTVPTTIPTDLSEATPVGPLSTNEQLDLQFVLPSGNPLGLQSFLSQVYDPASPLYHQFLTPSEFYSLYSSDPVEDAALTTYLQSNGLQLQLSATNPNIAEVNGTVAQIQNALRTQIDSFSWNGTVFYSATSQAQLPTQFSNVQMIYGLENFSQTAGKAFPLYRILGTITPNQIPTSYGHYYSPSEIRQAYNATSLLKAGYTGTGVSIAIVDAYGDPYIQQELKNFSGEFGLPFYNGTLHIIPVGPYYPSNGIGTGWNEEIALDVEWAHAMAPNATINLYVASDDSDQLLEAVLSATLGSNGTANGVYHNNIISLSWGEAENDFASSTPKDPYYGLNYQWLNQVFQMDAALGITVFASSGDWGAYDQAYGQTSPYAPGQTSPYGSAIWPSTDPYVTGVGGTSLYMNTSSGYYQWPYENATGNANETAWSWNIYYQWGTGGGWSTLYSQPSWQTGAGVVNNGERGDPDVAWDADPLTGVLVSVFDYYGLYVSNGYDYYVFGGTSVGAPCWAGAMALIDQKAGRSLGFINPAIYSILNNATEYSKAFHDVTVGNNNPYGATKGWDPLTGVGSPNIGELAYYLAPTGRLPVVVTNDFSNSLGQAYAYRQVINLTAIVADNRTITGPVTTTITSSTGATIATGITLTYNARHGAWLGSYAIKLTDPPGEWSVIVTANNSSYLGKGYVTLDVGDGVTISPTWEMTVAPGVQQHSRVYQIGDTIRIYSYAVDPRGQFVTNGTYTATFYLAQNQTTGNGLGKVEGKVPLCAIGFLGNSTDYFIRGWWEGSFTIPRSVDQGVWIMVVNGTDANGNKGTAYTWINVGLRGTIFPNESSPILGEIPSFTLDHEISIEAFPVNENGSAIQTGVFTAMFYAGSTFLARVPLTFFASDPLTAAPGWGGGFTPSTSDPTGFYTITVNGTDGKGNCGSFSTVVEVARYSLSVTVSLSSPSVPLKNGNESWALAKVTYPDGSPMTAGFVNGFVICDPSSVWPGSIPVIWFTMTYNQAAGGFVGTNFLHTTNYPLEGWELENTISWIGNYDVYVEAYDTFGNYGTGKTAFMVTTTNHAAIDIRKDADFTAANGVTGGNGTSKNPYMISGWNVSSISITNVTSSYELRDDYVSGSAGNGITINTPKSRPTVIDVDTVQNKGNGLYANDSPAGIYYVVVAGNNEKNGILVANDTEAGNGSIDCITYDNALNGVVCQASNQPQVSGGSFANAQAGVLSQDSKNTSIQYSTLRGNKIGIEVTGQNGSWYDFSQIRNNWVWNNTIGIYIDGLNQNLTTAKLFGNPSYAIVYQNDVKQNGVGVYAANNAVAYIFDDHVYNGDIGISTVNSLVYLTYSNVQFNTANGIQTVGQSPFEAQKAQLSPATGNQFNFGHDFGTVVANSTAENNGNSGISIGNAVSAQIVDDNVAFNHDDGIELNNVTGMSSQNSTAIVQGNNVFNNTKSGMQANNVTYSAIIRNNVTENSCGIFLNYSSGNVLSSNVMASNTYNFGVYGAVLNEFVNYVDTSNFAEGKPICYLVNQSNINVSLQAYPEGVGYLGLIDCKNVTVQGLTLTRDLQGLLLAFTNDSKIINNNITANNEGILLRSSSNNTIYHNNFINNTHQAISDGLPNTWDNGYPSAGNYWSDYTGVDLCGGPYQNITGSDGIGDTPYNISVGNADLYPLMSLYSSLALSVSVSPSSAALDAGQSQTFKSLVYGGTLPYTYQWLWEAPGADVYSAISGANLTSYSFVTSGATALGVWHFELNLTDSAGVVVTSKAVTVSVNPVPSVTLSPASVTLDVGQSQLFTSDTGNTGTSPFSYQWYLNGTLFSGATSSSWWFTPSSPGSYSVYVKVTDSAGVTATSNNASVAVIDHDITVTSVTPSKGVIVEVVQGHSVSVNITVWNEGSCTETFNVTLYGELLWGWYAENDTFPLYVFTRVTLTPGSTVTLTVSLTLPAFPWGVYGLKAIAGPVPGQTRVSDLKCTGGYISVFSSKIRVWWSYGRCGWFGFMPL
jgi:parallel beta-helix repeat protein